MTSEVKTITSLLTLKCKWLYMTVNSGVIWFIDNKIDKSIPSAKRVFWKNKSCISSRNVALQSCSNAIPLACLSTWSIKHILGRAYIFTFSYIFPSSYLDSLYSQHVISTWKFFSTSGILVRFVGFKFCSI